MPIQNYMKIAPISVQSFAFWICICCDVLSVAFVFVEMSFIFVFVIIFPPSLETRSYLDVNAVFKWAIE